MRRRAHAAPTLLLGQSRPRGRMWRGVRVRHRTHQGIRGSRPSVESIPCRLADKRLLLACLCHPRSVRFSLVRPFGVYFILLLLSLPKCVINNVLKFVYRQTVVFGYDKVFTSCIVMYTNTYYVLLIILDDIFA